MLVSVIYVGLCRLALALLGTDLKTVNLCVTQSEESCNERMIERVFKSVLTLNFRNYGKAKRHN